MKFRTFLAVFLSVLCILALIALGAFILIDQQKMSQQLTKYHTEFNMLSQDGQPETSAPADIVVMDEAPAETIAATEVSPAAETAVQTSVETAPQEPQTEKATDAAEAPAAVDQQTKDAMDAASAANNDTLPAHHIIFVGDSRTVSMGKAETPVGDTCTYIGADGEGYSWFEKDGIHQMEDAMNQFPDAPVVINLGVNDPDMAASYISLYQNISADHPGTSIYFMSVNPVSAEAKMVTNAEIFSFNNQLQAAFPSRFIDTYLFLQIQEFKTVDGVHYNEDTSRMIHDYVVKKLAA